MLKYCRENAVEVRENELLSAHTTFKIGGPADLLALPDTEEKLCSLLAAARESGVHTVVIGRGSNLLAPDAGFRGLVISTAALCGCERAGETAVRAGCGILLSKLASFAAGLSLTGLEFAHGIPGSLGGAVVMNAGAYGGEMVQVLRSSRVLLPDGSVAVFDLPAHELGYRSSFFKSHPDHIVLASDIELRHGDRVQIEACMADLAARRRDKQPLQYPSAGSAYKRPEGHFAGQLIEQCGLKGFGIGGAFVSDKHAGFIVNMGGATADDVLRLMDHIEKTVLAETGIALEREIRLLQ